ncbi:MAG: hypothetical protein PVI01_11355 [Gemmatimonadales bacterium]|jgi:hypothetical protein
MTETTTSVIENPDRRASLGLRGDAAGAQRTFGSALYRGGRRK